MSLTPLGGNTYRCTLLYYFTLTNGRQLTHEGESIANPWVNQTICPVHCPSSPSTLLRWPDNLLVSYQKECVATQWVDGINVGFMV